MTMQTTAKLKLLQVNEYGPAYESAVGLVFGPDYADGANEAWAQNTPALRLEMTVRADIAEALGVRAGQPWDLTLTLGELIAAVTADDGDGHDLAAMVVVPDPVTGELAEVPAHEAAGRGYDVHETQGLATGGMFTQPVAPLDVEQGGADTPADESEVEAAGDGTEHESEGAE